MNSIIYARALLLFGLLLSVALCLGSTSTSAQDSIAADFEAPLMGVVDGQPVRKGTAHGAIDGEELRLLVSYDGLVISGPTFAAAALFRGDPNAGGAEIQNLAGALGPGGGFESTIALTTALRQDLDDGLLYVQVRTVSVSPGDSVSGQLLVAPVAEFAEARLSYMHQGYPTSRGTVRVLPVDGGLRLIGYFNALESNWQRITVYRGEYGKPGEHVASVYNFGSTTMYSAFDQVLTVPDEDLAEALHNRQLSVAIETSRSSDSLFGRLLSRANRAPDPSYLVAPGDGETIVIGGLSGDDPVPPDAYLGMVELDRVDDADGDPIHYTWQLSLRPSFGPPDHMTTIELGVDSIHVPLSVGRAAALYDLLFGGEPGGIQFDTPVEVYHRVITTDGSRHSVGPTTQTTFVRGAITANGPDPTLPDELKLRGNYPNPFHARTTVTFDLPAQSDVRIELFNLLGQQVLAVPAGLLAAGDAHSVEIDAASLSTGSYLYRVIAQESRGVRTATGSMFLMK